MRGATKRGSKEEKSFTGVFLRVLDKWNDVLSVAVDIEGFKRFVTVGNVGVEIDGKVAEVYMYPSKIVTDAIGGIKITSL